MRYSKYNYLINNFLLSKNNIYSSSNLSDLSKIEITAGHFKFNNLYPEHALVLLNITGQLPVVNFYKHGKRQKQTVSLKININKQNIWQFIDKFVNIVLPSVEDLRQPILKKPFKQGSTYNWRLRKFFEWEDIFGFLTDRLLRKDVFLPLSINFTFSKSKNHKFNENYLRMLRLPFIFYKKNYMGL